MSMPQAVLVDDPGVVYTASELCRLTSLELDYLQELIDYGIVEPRQYETSTNKDKEARRFTQVAIIRIRQARRLQRDFELNLEGVALAMTLKDKNRALKAKVAFLERLINRWHQQK